MLSIINFFRYQHKNGYNVPTHKKYERYANALQALNECTGNAFTPELLEDFDIVLGLLKSLKLSQLQKMQNVIFKPKRE